MFATARRPKNDCSSHAWLVQVPDAAALRTLRACLGRWAMSGRGTTRSWRIGPVMSPSVVHVVVQTAPADADSVLALTLELAVFAPGRGDLPQG